MYRRGSPLANVAWIYGETEKQTVHCEAICQKKKKFFLQLSVI